MSVISSITSIKSDQERGALSFSHRPLVTPMHRHFPCWRLLKPGPSVCVLTYTAAIEASWMNKGLVGQLVGCLVVFVHVRDRGAKWDWGMKTWCGDGDGCISTITRVIARGPRFAQIAQSLNHRINAKQVWRAEKKEANVSSANSSRDKQSCTVMWLFMLSLLLPFIT